MCCSLSHLCTYRTYSCSFVRRGPEGRYPVVEKKSPEEMPHKLKSWKKRALRYGGVEELLKQRTIRRAQQALERENERIMQLEKEKEKALGYNSDGEDSTIPQIKQEFEPDVPPTNDTPIQPQLLMPPPVAPPLFDGKVPFMGDVPSLKPDLPPGQYQRKPSFERGDRVPRQRGGRNRAPPHCGRDWPQSRFDPDGRPPPHSQPDWRGRAPPHPHQNRPFHSYERDRPSYPYKQVGAPPYLDRNRPPLPYEQDHRRHDSAVNGSRHMSDYPRNPPPHYRNSEYRDDRRYQDRSNYTPDHRDEANYSQRFTPTPDSSYSPRPPSANGYGYRSAPTPVMNHSEINVSEIPINPAFLPPFETKQEPVDDYFTRGFSSSDGFEHEEKYQPTERDRQLEESMNGNPSSSFKAAEELFSISYTYGYGYKSAPQGRDDDETSTVVSVCDNCPDHVLGDCADKHDRPMSNWSASEPDFPPPDTQYEPKYSPPPQRSGW